jgi:hypothetical protein
VPVDEVVTLAKLHEVTEGEANDCSDHDTKDDLVWIN